MKQAWQDRDWLRIVEIVIIALFVVSALVWVVLSVSSVPAATLSQNASHLQVYAYALPHRGWAPLTVYFSAYGSQATKGEIVRYQWDLDGNGSFETDATAEGGYASYVYTKPRQYTITVKVTGEQGETATTSVLVDVMHPASSNVDY